MCFSAIHPRIHYPVIRASDPERGGGGGGGRYDGQTFVKPPEVLTRDRLLGMYEVKPILARLKVTLLAAGSTLMGTAAALAVLISAGADSDGVYGVSLIDSAPAPAPTHFFRPLSDSVCTRVSVPPPHRHARAHAYYRYQRGTSMPDM
jgi:hypothetical protein